jgi:PAS domain S-box-containing protein
MISFTELININSLKKIAENIYAVAGIPMGVVGIDGTIELAVGWQDICTKYHRVNKTACKNCMNSDQYIKEHIKDGEYVAYKCLNNMREVAIPIIISDIHVATAFFGQFFYDDEVIDVECFREQALKFGFNEKQYLEALSKVPVFSKEKVQHIIEYYKGLIMTLAESGFRQLEYKNSQKELQTSQEYLNTIFNSVNDAIFIINFYGHILDVNKTATVMFGYCADELIDMNIQQVISFKSKYFDKNMEKSLNEAKKLNKRIFELICKDKNNKEFWVEVNLRIVTIGGDEIILATVRDITERKQAELTLQNEAFELEKLRTEFFANISHELRTPLNILLGAIKIINMNLQKEVIDKEKIIKNINIQTQNCFRLLRLINNLIDSTKLDAGYLEVNMINCNIVSIIEKITLSVVEYTNINNLSLIFDTDIEEKIVACDLDKIERIMLNLLSNAIKFTKPGGDIFVNIYDGAEFITISVEDNGIGIPDDKLDIIFDRFRQVDKSFTRDHEGSGIGLSLVKALVEMQGGAVNVESKYGSGTKFFVKLPVRLVDNSNSKQTAKLIDSSLNNCVERAKVEFSDIYML